MLFRSMMKAKNISLEVLPPEKSSYVKDGSGFHIYVNVRNTTPKPIKLELKECTIFKNGRQNISDYNLTGYVFNQEYIFPASVKTFAKIWITDKWQNKDLSTGDYLTLLFKNLENGELYYYKFNYSDQDKVWFFADYYNMN